MIRRGNRLLAGGTVLVALAFPGCAPEPPAPALAPPPTQNFQAVVAANPVDPELGGSSIPVLPGQGGTVNVWQLEEEIPAHFHRETEEFVLVLEGEGEVRLGEETRRLREGDMLLVPRGVVHRVQAVGDQPFRGVSFFAPAYDGTDRVPVTDD